MILSLTLRIKNTELLPISVSLTSWGKGVSLALIGNTPSDRVTRKILYGVDILSHQTNIPSFPIGLVAIESESLDQLRRLTEVRAGSWRD